MTRNFLPLLMLALLWSPGPTCPAEETRPTVRPGSLTHGKVKRTYRLHLPPAPRAKKSPLLLLLHGGGGKAEHWERSAEGRELIALAHKRGWIVVCPQGLNKQWNDGRDQIFTDRRGRKSPAHDDVGYISSLIDHLDEKYGVDLARVYSTGISNGGFMSFRLGVELAGKITAIAPVTAQLSEKIKDTRPKLPMPIMILNGTEDPLVPYSGGHVRILGGRSRGKILSTDDTVARFLEYNGCATKPVVKQMPDLDPADGCRVTISTWSGGRSGSEVILVKVTGGGHTWPGGTQYFRPWLIGTVTRDISGSKMIVEFFARHARSRKSPRPDRQDPIDALGDDLAWDRFGQRAFN